MNLKRLLFVVFALGLAISFSWTRLAAQTATTGAIVGTVTDPSGAVVPNATVDLKDNVKGASQSTKTSGAGVYQFNLLDPASYAITVTASGFQTYKRTVEVPLGSPITINVSLSVAGGGTTVTVTEAAPLVQTENGDTATALSQQQVSQVPNPGNDLSAIAQLAPGVVINSQGGFGNVEAFGLPATSNLFTLNGMDDNDPFLNLNNSGASNLLLGQNEIQEADVVTNGYSGAYGTFGGINVNYVTKSGGNDFHGNAVYFWNGRAMNANDWFNNAAGRNSAGQPNNPRAFDNANQWAASFGGPIKKDKLFFFLNTEGLRVLIPVPSTVFVPTPAFEAAVVQNLTNLGDTASIPYYCQNLAGICPGVGPLPGSGGGIFNFFNGVKNVASAVNNLAGGGCSDVGPATGSGGLFATFGAANPCALSIRETPINFAPEKQIAGRADWNIGPNDRMFLRMQYDQGVQPTFTDAINPIFNAQSDQPEYQGQLSETHSFGPTTVNQFLLAATWYSAIFQPSNLAKTLAAFPTTLIMGDASLGMSGPTTAGSCGVGFACDDFIWPQGRNVTQFQVQDDVSKTLGNHTLKFGGKFHRNYVSDHDFGLFSSGAEIPFSLASFANGGDPAAAGTVGGELLKNFPNTLNAPVRLYEVAGYIQDEWRVKSNFTITPTLRAEHASNPTCLTLCFAELGVPFANIGTVLPYNQLINANRRNALLGYQNLQWEPRISFAWQPFSTATGWLKSNFVVRGGVGIFYDIFPGQVADNLNSNAPLDDAFTIVAVPGSGLPCPGFVSPNQTSGPNGSNLFGCAAAAQAAFQTAFASGASATSFIPNLTFGQRKNQAPQYQKWSLEIQKGFGANTAIDIGYFGNHGLHEPILNNSLNAFGFGSLPAAAATNQFVELIQVSSNGVSNYHGLTASFKQNFSGWAGSGVLQVNYTYSHAFDLVSNGGFNSFNGISAQSFANPFNAKVNYGPADYDVRHGVNANYVWEVPVRKALFGHGWKQLVDGWQVSGSVFSRTGFPYTIIDGAEQSFLSGSHNFFGPFWPSPLTAVNPNCASEAHAGPAASPCFTVSTVVPHTCTVVTAGQFPAPGCETALPAAGLRNAFRGPKYFDTDFSFTKKTKIPGWERGELQLGLQFFNLFNHPNFTLPVNNTTNPQFGTIQSTVNPPTSILGSFLGGDASPRLIQIKAQFTF